MRVSGRATMDAPRDEVFAAICDPGALMAIIPGCVEIRRVSDTDYRGRMAFRLPGIVGAFETFVRLTEADPPALGAFEGRIEGRPGSVVGRAVFRLTETDGRTVVEYDGDGLVGGPLARLDARFLEGIAARLVGEGLARLGRRLARPAGSRAEVAT